MATTITRQQRQASPVRWRKAAERAIAENVQVRQLAGSGAWIATSGSDAATVYELHKQRDRRNLTGKELVKVIAMVDLATRKAKGGAQQNPYGTNQYTGKVAENQMVFRPLRTVAPRLAIRSPSWSAPHPRP